MAASWDGGARFSSLGEIDLFYLGSVAPFPHWNATGTNYLSRRVRIIAG